MYMDRGDIAKIVGELKKRGFEVRIVERQIDYLYMIKMPARTLVFTPPVIAWFVWKAIIAFAKILTRSRYHRAVYLYCHKIMSY